METGGGGMTAAEIKRLRAHRQETQEEFAVVVGVSTYTVSKWETARHKPTGLSLRRLREMRDNQKGVGK